MSNLTQIVADLYANFGKGNIPAIAEAIAEDIHWIHSGGPDLPYAKIRQGKAQVMAFFSDLAGAVEITQFAPKTYVEQGDTVVALGHWGGRAKKTNKPFESDWAMVWTFAGRKVKFYQAFEDTHALAKAFH
jgi:ketosteroid isomerase-like protein